jgi:glutamate N-acetyltransferase/amino-acid N-acetyltransferase
VQYDDADFPRGFAAAATHCGVKKKSGVLDLGVLVSTSDKPCAAAACFTRNVFKAAPVTVSTEVLKRSHGRAAGLVVNSGCANAVTGTRGMKDAWSMSQAVNSSLPKSTSDRPGTLVLSTGVIGQHLPIDSITSAVPKLTSTLASTASAWMNLAKSFMTTDTFPKLRVRSFKLGNNTVRMAGIDKGAGMIHPNMGPPHATLLGVIATDAAIAPHALQTALTYAVDRSFNAISVDGDMSTNDTILCLANGAADGQNEEISEQSHPEEFAVFKDELKSFAEELAQLVVRDGEGATKFVTVRVEVRGAGARSRHGPSIDKRRPITECSKLRCGQSDRFVCRHLITLQNSNVRPR